MRLAVVCNDTRGGVEPYVALAVGAKRAGHSVQAVAPQNLCAMFDSHGITVAPLSGDVEAVLRSAGGVAEKGSLASMRLAARELPRRIEQWTRETLEGCQGAELVLGGIGGMVVGLSVADKLKVPFIEAQLQPVFAPTGAYPGVIFPSWPRWLWRLSHSASNAALWLPFKGPMMRARREVLALDGEPRAALGQPVLFGFSRHVVDVPPARDRARHVTGYWALEPGAWSPPPDLAGFVERGGRPIVAIGFGSMASANARALTAIVLEAVRLAGVRAVMVTGWGGLERVEAAGEHVFFCDAVPYAWLYPRMAAVVHHGGAGTTGLGLRSGTRSIVVPFAVDQPFWGMRVHRLGAGPKPLPRKRLNAETLAERLRETVESEPMRRRAAELGEAIRSEDGVAAAVGVLEKVALK